VNTEGNNNKKKGRHNMEERADLWQTNGTRQLKKKSRLEKLPLPLPRLHRKNHSENSKR
jgi:hypothetical protein